MLSDTVNTHWTFEIKSNKVINNKTMYVASGLRDAFIFNTLNTQSWKWHSSFNICHCLKCRLLQSLSSCSFWKSYEELQLSDLDVAFSVAGFRKRKHCCAIIGPRSSVPLIPPRCASFTNTCYGPTPIIPLPSLETHQRWPTSRAPSSSRLNSCSWRQNIWSLASHSNLDAAYQTSPRVYTDLVSAPSVVEWHSLQNC